VSDENLDADEELEAELPTGCVGLGKGRAGGGLELSLLYHSKPLVVISDNLVATMLSIEMMRRQLRSGSTQRRIVSYIDHF
jgi:hypothetical protein